MKSNRNSSYSIDTEYSRIWLPRIVQCKKQHLSNKKRKTNSIYTTLGASNHTEKLRHKEDYYATSPMAAELLLQNENFANRIWECACGEGHLSNVFISNGYEVKSSDLVNRGYGESGIDFLNPTITNWEGDIVTNPPYKYAQEFVEKALQIVPEGKKVAMFLRIQFLEGKRRKNLFLSNPPKTIYVSSSRLQCAKNAEFEKMKAGGGSAIAFAWFVWEKGYTGTPAIKWIN